jgi:hypothetical protein
MFLKRIFKKPPPPEPVPEKLDLETLCGRVDKLRKEKLETVRPALDTLLDEITKAREILLSDLKRLAEANPSEEVHLGLLKTSTEAKKLFVEKITRALADIDHGPELTTSALEGFDLRLAKAINLTTDAATVHGRYVGATFGMEFAAVKSDLRRLHELAGQVHETIEGALNENRKIETLSSEINSYVELTELLKKTYDDIRLLEGLYKEIENTTKDERGRLEQLRSGEDFKRAVETGQELKQIELEIRRVEGEVKSAFSDISRPLRKLEKLVSSGRHQMDGKKAKILALCINNPLEIISSEEKISTAEELLREAAKLLEEGKIELGERERRKKLGRTLKLAEKLKLFKESLDSLKRQLELQHTSEHPVLRQISELEKSIAQLESKLNSAKTSIEELHQKTELTEKELAEKRTNIEKLATETLGVKIELTF